MQKKISVIIPVYKVEKYLEECIESVLKQTYKEIEIILVDDGSPDSCPQICDRYAETDTRVQVIHKKNGGLSSARNTGIEYATGEYILFLDSDDYWDSTTALYNLVQDIEEDIDILIFRYKKFIESFKKTIYPLPDINEKQMELLKSKEDTLKFMLERGLFIASACNKLVSRQFLVENKIMFREGVTSEDIEWCAKLLIKSKKIQYVNDCFYVYRERANSITTTMTKKNLIDLQGNIIRSICEGETELDQGSVMYHVFMQYMAYQYATFILCVHNVKEKNMYHMIEEMKKYAWVLQYSQNKKVILFRNICKLGGFRILYYVSKLYMKYIYGKI